MQKLVLGFKKIRSYTLTKVTYQFKTSFPEK